MTSLKTRTLLCLAVTVPAGFCVKFYGGPGAGWTSPYGAAVVYEIFWCLAAFLFFPARRSVPIIAAAVFFITCALEFMQLWHPPLLETVRSFPPGAWLIGSGFDWADFPHYALGSGLGWAVLRILDRR
jgi:phosphotransferase system  glucose/maltose/N-acetylglucosamine-specific IIC component